MTAEKGCVQEVDAQTLAQNVDTPYLFITLREFVDRPLMGRKVGDGSSLGAFGVVDPTELFMPLMNLQQARGVEGQERRQRERGEGQRERMRAASLAGTNFVLGDMLAADEGEGLDTTLMTMPSEALVDEIGATMKSEVDMNEAAENRPSLMRRSKLQLNIDEEAKRVDLFKGAARHNIQIGAGQV